MRRNQISLALIAVVSLVALCLSSTVDARRVTPGRRRRQEHQVQPEQSSGRHLRQRHLKQEEADKKDEKSSSKTAAPTAAPTIGSADDDIDANTTTASTVSRTIDIKSNSNSTQTTSTGTSQPTSSPTNITTTSPSPTAAPTVETYDCYDNNPCLDAAERQVYYYRHSDPTKFVQCGAAATCFTMSCHEGLVWSLEGTTCIDSSASP